MNSIIQVFQETLTYSPTLLINIGYRIFNLGEVGNLLFSHIEIMRKDLKISTVLEICRTGANSCIEIFIWLATSSPKVWDACSS